MGFLRGWGVLSPPPACFVKIAPSASRKRVQLSLLTPVGQGRVCVCPASEEERVTRQIVAPTSLKEKGQASARTLARGLLAALPCHSPIAPGDQANGSLTSPRLRRPQFYKMLPCNYYNHSLFISPNNGAEKNIKNKNKNLTHSAGRIPWLTQGAVFV